MSDTIFEKGLKIDVTDHIEKKGQFSYLSWVFAVRELRKLDTKATWRVESYNVELTNDNGILFSGKYPYMQTKSGCFVEVVVTLGDGNQFHQVHPVLDNRNNTVINPNAFQVNTSIQRCLTKAIALASGIGLHLYAGEDLPESDKDREIINEVHDQFPDSKEVMSIMEFEELLESARDNKERKGIWLAHWEIEVKHQCGPKELEKFKKIHKEIMK